MSHEDEHAWVTANESHSMPRARRHIQELLDEHEMQVDRVAELERLIQEVCLVYYLY